MRSMIDSKVLKVMNLAIKYIGKLTEEDLDKLLSGEVSFSIVGKDKSIREKGKKNKRIEEVNDSNNWISEIKELKEFSTREEASEYIRRLKLNKEKLINLGQALGISIAKSTKKENIIAMIVEGTVGSRLKVEGIRKGIIGEE